MSEAAGAVWALLDQATPARAGFQRGHIFHSILAYCGRDETEDGRMNMMYQFSLYQRCLAAALKRDTVQSAALLEAVRAGAPELLTPRARAGMEALFFPVLAYTSYAERRYGDAIGELEQGMARLLALHEGGFGDAILALIDQNVNLVRIYFAMGHSGQGVEASFSMLQCLYGGRGDERLRHVRLLDVFSGPELDSVESFFSDAVLLRVFGVSAELGEAFVCRLAAASADWRNASLRRACSALAALLDPGAPAPALDGIDLGALPEAIQYLLLRRLAAGCAGDDGLARAVEQRLAGARNYAAFQKWRLGPAWQPARDAALAA